MTEVVPNQAYDAWNVKSLLFIPVFFVLRRLCQKGGIARFERDTIRRTDCLWKFAEREA